LTGTGESVLLRPQTAKVQAMKNCPACNGSGTVDYPDLRSATTTVVLSKAHSAPCPICDATGRVPDSYRSGLIRNVIDCDSCGRERMAASTRYCPSCGNNLWS
jgi:RecJ-like exonuclease